MSYSGQRHEAAPCPNCGRPDSARMVGGRWGHNHMCCSDECGLAFANSSKRCQIELDSLYRAQDETAKGIEHWGAALTAALYRENPGRRRQLALDLIAGAWMYTDYEPIIEALAVGEVTPEEVAEPLLKWAREQAAQGKPVTP